MNSHGFTDPVQLDNGKWQVRWRDPHTRRIRRKSLPTKEQALDFCRQLDEKRAQALSSVNQQLADIGTMITRIAPDQIDIAEPIILLDPTSKLGQLSTSLSREYHYRLLDGQ